MEKLLIVGCKRSMDDVCIACSRCHVGFNRKEGEFNRYSDMDIQLTGILNCGDCPGASIVPRLSLVNLWNKPFDEKITKIHIAPCIFDHCPYSEVLISKIKAKSGIEVVIGTHPYIPENIFA